MRRPATLAFCVALASALALGCSSSSLDKNNTGGAGGAAQCTAPGYAPNPEPASTTINEVDAALHDPSGAPVPNLLVQVCGIDLCINGTTNAAGKTSVAPRMALLRPAFKYGDGFDYAKLAAKLGPDAQQNLGQLVALPLPTYADGAAFPSGTTAASTNVSNGDLTLIIPSGDQITHDILTYSDPSERVFRSVSIPLADSTAAVDPSLGFEIAYAVAPVSTVFCPAAQLRVANTLSWDPNTAVEVFIQGLEVDEKWAPYAAWTKVADASVSADGSAIETTSGGIPILSSIALRRK